MREPEFRWPGVTHVAPLILDPFASGLRDYRGLYRSSYFIEGFAFCRQIDLYAIIEPGERALLIDTGHMDLCGTRALDGVSNIYRVPWENIDVFITHFHDDHDGNLLYCLDHGTRRVYYRLPYSFGEDGKNRFLMRVGAQELDCQEMSRNLDLTMGIKKTVRESEPQRITCEGGEVLSYGRFNLEVLPTPGHTLHHLCLLDRDKKLLFAGDHVVDAPPSLLQFSEEQHLTQRYLISLQEIRDLDLEAVLMSHHNPIFGAQAIDGFITLIKGRYETQARRMGKLVHDNNRVTVYRAAQIGAAHYKEGLSGFTLLVQLRRIATMFAALEYLHDLGMAGRGEEDDGSFVYWMQRSF